MDVTDEDVPQMWALYKEVKEYFDSGMEIPEDVTLLWGDDNFGNIRRLPTKEERTRRGGAGIYYHFDYVGGPRSYKWLNTVPIQKTYEQMSKAYEYEAKKLWIVNVGDLKPMEFQTEFFMKLAWNIEAFNPENLELYAREWAHFTFGKEHGNAVAQIIRDYVKVNGRMKPEVINLVDQYSWDNEFEAERVLRDFHQTVELAEKTLRDLPGEYKDAFYQVAYYPAKASYTILKLQLLADLSRKYQEQGRRATNSTANEAKRLFNQDKELTFEYNKRIAHGKWDHMMDQLHIGYTYWQQPNKLVMPKVETLNDTHLSSGEWDIEIQNTPETDTYSKKPIVVDVYNKGNKTVDIEVVSSNEWIKTNCKTLNVSMQERLIISVDWNSIDHGENVKGSVMLIDSQSTHRVIEITVANPEDKMTGGFVPINGIISIEAQDYTTKKETETHHWLVLPDYGRTKSSMCITPGEFNVGYEPGEAPRLSYDLVLPKESKAEISVITAPSLPFDPDRGMRLGLSLDDQDVVVIEPGDLTQNGQHDSKDWEHSVLYNCHEFKLPTQLISEGKHTLHVTLIDPQVVIQKVVIDFGGVKPTYLGPLPTPHADDLGNYNAYEPIRCIDFLELPGVVKSGTSQVYCQESGMYLIQPDIDKAKSVKLDGTEQKINDEGTLFIDQGHHMLEVDEKCTLELVKPLPLLIKPVVTRIGNDLNVQLLLHYTGDASILVRAAFQVNEDENIFQRVSTKMWLKTDEQQVKTFIFDSTDADFTSIDIEIDAEGFKRRLTLPINNKEMIE